MELDTIGDEKTVLFLIMSDTDTTFNFILAMLQSQLINLLCDRADDKYGGRLPVHVRLILDEFANIGQIPNFDKLIATIRSREISASGRFQGTLAVCFGCGGAAPEWAGHRPLLRQCGLPAGAGVLAGKSAAHRRTFHRTKRKHD